MPTIHPTAIIDPEARLADDVRIEAYAIIGAGVTIETGTTVLPHSVIYGPTLIGKHCMIGPAAYVGLDGQHLTFLAKPLVERQLCWLIIGDNVIIRETATLHRATKPGQENAARVGDDCLIMGAAHVAHDCVLADHVVMANGVLLGGHCVIGARAFLGGGCGVHQFARVGRLAMIAGNEPVGHDVPPFGAMFHGGLKGYNAVGCRRAGMSRETIAAIRTAYHCLHNHRTTNRVLAAIKERGLETAEVKELTEFIRSTRRGIQPSLRFLNYLQARETDTE